MFTSLRKAVKSTGNFLQSPLLLMIRLFWGYQFALTGFGKFLHFEKTTGYFQSLGIPFPALSVALAGSAELIGGVLLILGLYSRIAALPLIVTMCMAYVMAHYDALVSLFTKFDPDPFLSQTPFLFLYAALLVFCFGPGKISLDYWRNGSD